VRVFDVAKRRASDPLVPICKEVMNLAIFWRGEACRRISADNRKRARAQPSAPASVRPTAISVDGRLQLESIAGCEREFSEISQCATGRTTAAALDRRERRGFLNVVKYNSQRVAVDADNLKAALIWI